MKDVQTSGTSVMKCTNVSIGLIYRIMYKVQSDVAVFTINLEKRYVSPKCLFGYNN